MYHRMIILALLFLIPEKSSTQIFPFSPMEISDALPVQFWLTGCATYNEHLASGVHHKCFCAPWECDDNIKIQFKDDPSQSFSLLVLDENEAIIDEIAIEETSVGVYEIGYIPSAASPEVCEQFIKLQIRKEAGAQGVTLPELSLWANGGGAGDPWTLGATPSIATSALGTDSEDLFVDYAFIVGVEYSIAVNFTNTNNTGGLFTVKVTNGAFVTQFSEDKSGAAAGPNISDVLTFVATADTTRIAISLSFLGSSNTTTINSLDATRSLGSDEIVAKTDCLDIRQDHPDTVLLTYSNHRNFAGLVYENISPENEFQIRIPAIFFHQRFPEEDEVIELSSSLLTLNGTLRKQRLMNINYAPYYFHEKVKLTLKHQILEIFNRQWVKQESYEIVEGDRRWPLKKANVWLSEKDFVHRNIL